MAKFRKYYLCYVYTHESNVWNLVFTKRFEKDKKSEAVAYGKEMNAKGYKTYLWPKVEEITAE